MKKNRPTLVEKAQIQGYHANRRHFAKTITGQDPAYGCGDMGFLVRMRGPYSSAVVRRQLTPWYCMGSSPWV